MTDGSFGALALAQALILGALIALPVAVYALYRTFRFVLAHPYGRGARALQMLRVWGLRLALIAGGIVLVHYAMDVRQRRHAGSCQREPSPREVGQYVAEICLPPARDTALLRLYSAESGALLAERLYEHPEPRVVWMPGGLLYDTAAADDEGVVSLPPSWWDRALALLP